MLLLWDKEDIKIFYFLKFFKIKKILFLFLSKDT